MIHLKDLEQILKEHPEITSMSITGHRFPRWNWEFKDHPTCRHITINASGGRATIFFHKRKQI